MTEKRFQVYKVIGSFHEWSIEDTIDDKIVFGSIMHKYEADRLCECLNSLADENKELKSDNDIKFWKLQFIRFYNSNGIIMHELGKAIEEGYEVSNEFKQYLHDLKVQNEKNVEKAKRLGI